MKRAILSALLGLSGCAHRMAAPVVIQRTVIAAPIPICVTPCGLIGVFVHDCEGLAREESTVLAAYAENVPTWTRERSCSAVRGFSLEVWPSVDENHAWMYRGMHVLGITSCSRRRMFVGHEVWNYSALAHELGHVIACKLEPTMSQHEGWARRGICSAVNSVSKLTDDCNDAEYR